MIEINPGVRIDEDEVEIAFIRASGPGGQNVNKVSTAVQLRWNARANPTMPAEALERLSRIAGSRMTEEGVLIIEARRHRTQEQNRGDALQRMVNLVRESLVKPKVRRPTRPGVTASAARVGSKRKRGELKRWRRYLPEDWE